MGRPKVFTPEENKSKKLMVVFKPDDLVFLKSINKIRSKAIRMLIQAERERRA